MVVLRTPGTVVARDLILATDVTNIVGAILGTAGYGQLIRMVDLEDATNYTNVFGNKDTTNGRAVKIQYGDHAGSPVTLATFAKAAITLDLPATIKQVALADPGTGYTSIGARTSDGAPVYRASGGSETLLASAADSPSTILTATGSIIYASAANTAAERTIGSTHQVLTVAGGLPTWANGSKATLTTAGDLLYGTGSNGISRLAIGTARQVLLTNAGATAPEWGASMQSLMTAQGDILQASAANTPARLAIGTARQTLLVNSGATGLAYAASLQSLMTGTGDLVYSSGANAPARLPIGTAGQVLSVNAGATAPEWTTNTITRNQVASAVGVTSGPTTTSTSYVDMTDMSVTLTTTTGGDLIAWFTGIVSNSASGNTVRAAFSLDGAAEVGGSSSYIPANSSQTTLSLVRRFTGLSAGSHTVKVRWFTTGGTAMANSTDRSLVMLES